MITVLTQEHDEKRVPYDTFEFYRKVNTEIKLVLTMLSEEKI